MTEAVMARHKLNVILVCETVHEFGERLSAILPNYFAPGAQLRVVNRQVDFHLGILAGAAGLGTSWVKYEDFNIAGDGLIYLAASPFFMHSAEALPTLMPGQMGQGVDPNGPAAWIVQKFFAQFYTGLTPGLETIEQLWTSAEVGGRPIKPAPRVSQTPQLSPIPEGPGDYEREA